MALDMYVATLFGGICGQPVNNVMHFVSTETAGLNPVTGARHLNAAIGDGTVAGEYSTLFLDCLPSNYTLLGIRSKRVNNGGGPTVTTTFTPIVGNRAGVSDVSGIGPVGLWHAEPTPGKWVTGKIFFPGAANADITDNQFAPALRAACELFTGLSQSTFGVGPIGPWQQVLNHQPGNTVVTILDDSVSKKVGTQRRRYVPL